MRARPSLALLLLTLVSFEISAPYAHAGVMLKVAAVCRDLFWTGKISRDPVDVSPGQWIVPAHDPFLIVQVVAVSPTHVIVREMNFRTRRTEEKSLPRPPRFKLARDEDFSLYQRFLGDLIGRRASSLRAFAGLDPAVVRASPVGALAELTSVGFDGFRDFRRAFLRGELKVGAAVLYFDRADRAELEWPREEFDRLPFYRIESVGDDHVVLKMEGRSRTVRGAPALAGLSFSFAALGPRAETLVAQFERRRRLTPSAAIDFSYLNDLDRIYVESLDDLGFDRAQLRHYFERIVFSETAADFFWPGARSGDSEREFMKSALNPRRVEKLSPATRAFAAELFDRALGLE